MMLLLLLFMMMMEDETLFAILVKPYLQLQCMRWGFEENTGRREMNGLIRWLCHGLIRSGRVLAIRKGRTEPKFSFLLLLLQRETISNEQKQAKSKIYIKNGFASPKKFFWTLPQSHIWSEAEWVNDWEGGKKILSRLIKSDFAKIGRCFFDDDDDDHLLQLYSPSHHRIFLLAACCGGLRLKLHSRSPPPPPRCHLRYSIACN